MDNIVDTKERVLAIALSRCHSIGPIRYRALLRYFGTSEHVWSAHGKDLRAAGLSDAIVNRFLNERSTVSPDQELERMRREDVRIILWSDQEYPPHLKELYDAPFALFVRGVLPQVWSTALAVVGTRRLTAYGMHITPLIVSELVNHGFVIVSGLAIGIDALAHAATVQNKGITLAVLGGGIDRATVQPRHNAYLAEQLIEHGGCLISEYPVGTPPMRTSFPQRNRIIAGLSVGVLVIEAPRSSGALITARIALDENREVFAVPGAITNPAAAGSNYLLQRGAHVVLSGQDIAEYFGLAGARAVKPATHRAPSELDPVQAALYACLSSDPVHADTLAARAQLDIEVTLRTLVIMELKGIAAHTGPLTYVRAHS